VTIEYRPPGGDEYLAFLRPIALAMGFPQSEEGAERFKRLIPPDRSIAAYDGDALVGSTAAHAFELSVPGGPVPCAGVAAVAVLPTHRRRGILRELMRRQLDELHERGEFVASLWASEAAIYGRFGYGVASLSGQIELERDRARFFDALQEASPARLVDSDEFLAAARPIYDRLRRDVPGFVSRSEDWWRSRTLRDSNGTQQRVLLDGPDGPEGYALYRTRDIWEDMIPTGRLEVQEALALSPAALRRAWSYLFEVDLIATVDAGFLPLDHPLLLLVSEPNRLHFTLVASLWVRLVEVGAALSARGYAADDAVVFDLRDTFCPWNEGRWRLEDGTAARTDDGADLALDIAGLGSVYLGGFTFGDLVRAGRADELADGATARADRLFATPRRPWTPEIF